MEQTEQKKMEMFRMDSKSFEKRRNENQIKFNENEQRKRQEV